MRIVIFGIGKFYRNRKHKIVESDDEIIAYIDNCVKSRKCFEGKYVYPPTGLQYIQYECIVLMSTYRQEMREQLLQLGVEENRIWTLAQYMCHRSRGKIQLHIGNPNIGKKRVLVLSDLLHYNGGCMAAMYATMALMSKGYEAWIASADGDERLIKEMVVNGLNVAICPGLPYIGKEELFWMKRFDIFLVNTFPMIRCAIEINKNSPVLWWIHEPQMFYLPNAIQDDVEYLKSDFGKMRVIAVSNIAKNNYEAVFPHGVNEIVPYGIPDENMSSDSLRRDGCTFAIIGCVGERKAQDLFVQAALRLIEKYHRKMQFWIIGQYSDDDYMKRIRNMIENRSQIKLLGTLTRTEIGKAFQSMDSVVCASLEDPLPIVVTEGMMHGKICITTDATGQAQMIRNGENGFVVKAGDVDDLYQKMEWVLLHKDKLEEMKKKARETYEEYFAMDRFGERLERELLQAKKIFYQENQL